MNKMLENIADAARDEIIADMDCGYYEAHGVCESPIEFAILHAVQLFPRIRSGGIFDELHFIDEDPDRLLDQHLSARVYYETQKQIGTYRVDFCFTVRAYLDCTDIGSTIPIPGNDAFLIVECDGHNFHERTPDQAARDRARDRDLQLQGFTVFRFTGREIYHGAWKCAEQIFEWAEEKARELHKEMRVAHGLAVR